MIFFEYLCKFTSESQTAVNTEVDYWWEFELTYNASKMLLTHAKTVHDAILHKKGARGQKHRCRFYPFTPGAQKKNRIPSSLRIISIDNRDTLYFYDFEERQRRRSLGRKHFSEQYEADLNFESYLRLSEFFVATDAQSRNLCNGIISPVYFKP